MRPLHRPADFSPSVHRPTADPTAPIRTMVWLYFWLLLWEGALRKWIFPSQSDILFIIRDPVAMFAYFLAFRAKVFPLRPAITVVGLLAAISLLFALNTEAPIMVLLFGLRTNYLHLPLVFLIGAVMSRDDVLRMGKWFMITSIPILFLMIRQFDASPDSMINASAGGYSGGQLRGAMGKIRPPGPFSFISGPVVYFSVVAAFVCHGWLAPKAYPRLWLVIGSVATIAAVPISISRSLLLGVLIVVTFAGAVAVRNLRNVPRLVGPLVAAASVFAFAADTIYVRAFLTRWDEAATAGQGDFYGNVVGRFLQLFTQPFEIAASAPLLGHGAGMGTVAGARLMTGEFTFMLSESELTRVILELGPILGFAFIAWRVWLALAIVWKGWQAVGEKGDVLPWLLAGSTFLTVLIGQWGQATQLGFAVLGAGLTIAALNDPGGDFDEKERR